MSYFTFDNKKIYYEENGSGTPLLFLHGNTASSKMFTDFSKRYTDSYKVILIDFLGHGRSERLSEFPADLWFYEAQQALKAAGLQFLALNVLSKPVTITSSGTL